MKKLLNKKNIKVISIFLSLAVFVFSLASCDLLWQTDLKETGDYLIFTTNSDINEPDWIDNNSFYATTGFTDEFVKVAMSGDIKETISLNNSAIGRINLISVSPDSKNAAVMAEYKASDFDPSNDNFNMLFYKDIYLYNFDTGKPLKITNSDSDFHGPTFYDNNTLIYFEYDRSVTDKVTMRMIKYTLDSAESTTIYENTLDEVDAFIYGDNYWRPKAKSGIAKVIMASRHLNSTETYGFDIFDLNGNLIQDGHQIITLAPVNGADWIDENNIALAGSINGQFYIYTVDLLNKTSTRIFTAPDEVENIYGLNISENGKYLISHVWMKAGGNRVLVVNL